MASAERLSSSPSRPHPNNHRAEHGLGLPRFDLPARFARERSVHHFWRPLISPPPSRALPPRDLYPSRRSAMASAGPLPSSSPRFHPTKHRPEPGFGMGFAATMTANRAMHGCGLPRFDLPRCQRTQSKLTGSNLLQTHLEHITVLNGLLVQEREKSDILDFEDIGMLGKVHVYGLDLGGLSACFITVRASKFDGRCAELCVKAHA